MAANPEAIAWYVQRSEALLDDHLRRVESLRGRGGQVAGFSGAVLALAGANVITALDGLSGALRVCAAASIIGGGILLIAALVTAVRGRLVPELVADLSGEEVANYTSERFMQEPDLWRVHVRTLRTLRRSVESTTRLGDRAAQAVGRAERLFLSGLSLVGITLAMLVLGTV